MAGTVLYLKAGKKKEGMGERGCVEEIASLYLRGKNMCAKGKGL